MYVCCVPSFCCCLCNLTPHPSIHTIDHYKRLTYRSDMQLRGVLRGWVADRLEIEVGYESYAEA